MRRIESITLKDGRSLIEVLELHEKWLKGEEGGKRADLTGVNLTNVNLSNLNLESAVLINTDLTGGNLSGTNLLEANLSGANLEDTNLEDINLLDANLEGANLTGANLKNANLSGANLSYANLESAYLEKVNLRNANLSYADLENADLEKANLTGGNLTKVNLIDADLTGIKYNNATISFELQCPEKGSFIGYKKANDKIVELLITEDAKRSSATTRRCRCSKAKVLSITSLDGKEEYTEAVSNYYSNFVYEVGKIVEVENFDENRWKEYAPGIHFFITRNEAVMY